MSIRVPLESFAQKRRDRVAALLRMQKEEDVAAAKRDHLRVRYAGEELLRESIRRGSIVSPVQDERWYVNQMQAAGAIIAP